mmetsp:Transcript_942/g.2270  ORF Transcript_942/g.2270 Transcript_942/m.2270 type:complete len:590 (-) Transcript_942:2236-4005(-)
MRQRPHRGQPLRSLPLPVREPLKGGLPPLLARNGRVFAMPPKALLCHVRSVCDLHLFGPPHFSSLGNPLLAVCEKVLPLLGWQGVGGKHLLDGDGKGEDEVVPLVNGPHEVEEDGLEDEVGKGLEVRLHGHLVELHHLLALSEPEAHVGKEVIAHGHHIDVLVLVVAHALLAPLRPEVAQDQVGETPVDVLVRLVEDAKLPQALVLGHQRPGEGVEQLRALDAHTVVAKLLEDHLPNLHPVVERGAEGREHLVVLDHRAVRPVKVRLEVVRLEVLDGFNVRNQGLVAVLEQVGGLLAQQRRPEGEVEPLAGEVEVDNVDPHGHVLLQLRVLVPRRDVEPEVLVVRHRVFANVHVPSLAADERLAREQVREEAGNQVPRHILQEDRDPLLHRVFDLSNNVLRVSVELHELAADGDLVLPHEVGGKAVGIDDERHAPPARDDDGVEKREVVGREPHGLPLVGDRRKSRVAGDEIYRAQSVSDPEPRVLHCQLPPLVAHLAGWRPHAPKIADAGGRQEAVLIQLVPSLMQQLESLVPLFPEIRHVPLDHLHQLRGADCLFLPGALAPGILGHVFGVFLLLQLEPIQFFVLRL